jgi:DNA-binding NtrC family response regulator
MGRKNLGSLSVCNPSAIPQQFSRRQSQSCISETQETQQSPEEPVGSTDFSASRRPAATRPANNRPGAVEIIGQSPQTQAMLDFIHRAAVNDFPVLLEGESGTGKELMARAIHLTSARAPGPFVAVNCGAMNPNLIESELFGHEKGAFTGAVSRKLGRFERANKGALFLDEIGELPLQDQVKLLRALQERRIERVGGTKEIEVDLRIVAATNRVLLDEVETGNFRQDLYYRLAVMTFIMPPLRDRVEDLPQLARHFLDLHCERMKLPVPRLTPEAEAALLRHHWPGNVRELENVIERTLALNGVEEIKAESLVFQTSRTKSKIWPVTSTERPESPDQGSSLIPPDIRLDDLALSEKRELVKRTLQQCYGNRRKAAALLGLASRHQLYRLMIKLGMTSPD